MTETARPIPRLTEGQNGGVTYGPEHSAHITEAAPELEDELLREAARPKVEYQPEPDPDPEGLGDLLQDIPEAPGAGFEYEDPDPEEDPEEGPEPEPKGQGGIIRLVVSNIDWLLSSLSGWLNERPRSNFEADKDGKHLITEAVTEYSKQVDIEFDPKAQVFYSLTLVYGGGLATGLFNRGQQLFSWIFKRKPKRAKTAPDIDEAEIIEEPEPTTPTGPRYCALPGCKKELKKSQKTYCSINHSAEHGRIKRSQRAQEKKQEEGAQ